VAGALLPSAQPQRRPGIEVVEQRRDHHVLMSPDGTSTHVLNETARAIWDLCDGATTREEIVSSILALFGERQEVVLKDVDRVLTELLEAGLIESVSGAERTADGEPAA
jgi:hypothetical protein